MRAHFTSYTRHIRSIITAARNDLPDIREIYDGRELPSISLSLELIGLGNMRMTRIGSGHVSDVFTTGHGQVLKIINMDAVAEHGGMRPVSDNVLQPVCWYNLNGLYQVELLPELDVKNVTLSDVLLVKRRLAEEGYSMSDAKRENVGLSMNRTPYVLDADAIDSKEEAGRKTVTRQWNEFPCKVLGTEREIIPGRAGLWEFSKSYGKEPARGGMQGRV